MPDDLLNSDLDWWTEQRRRQGTIGRTPTTIANTRDPLRSFRGIQRAFPGDVDVEQAYRMAEEQRADKPMMRAIVNGQEYQMESKGRSVRDDEALRMIQAMQAKRMADEDIAARQAERTADLEAKRMGMDQQRQLADLQRRSLEVDIGGKEAANRRSQAEFAAAGERNDALKAIIESGRFNDLGVSAQGGARIATAYRTGGIEAAKAALAREQQQQDQPGQDLAAIASRLAEQGRWREAQALMASAGVPSAIGTAGAVLGPMEEAQRRASAEAGRLRQQLSGFGQRDTTMFVDDPESEGPQRVREIEALAALYQQAGMTPEEARAEANKVAFEALSPYANKTTGGWSRNLLQSIGAY